MPIPNDVHRYPPLADYALIGDCHAAALVSRQGGIDWCCLPRFDSASVFGRLLDWEQGGTCLVAPDPPDGGRTTRCYLDGSLVLETTFTVDGGVLRVTDCFAMRRGGRHDPRRELMRIVDCVDGRVAVAARIVPRFDYGQTSPWLRQHGDGLFSAVGSSNGLVVWTDLPLQLDGLHDLTGRLLMQRGERRTLSIRFVPPESIDDPRGTDAAGVARHLEETLAWWRAWSSKATAGVPAAALRSAIVLKGLTHAPTGGMIAAPTTSLPETPGGSRNWDYRLCWVRDSTFAVRSLAELGFVAEADGFRRFVERSAAGSVDELQVLYGVGGERMVPEFEVPALDGYRGARPVRIGNAAAVQLQLDIYGELVDLVWEWHCRQRSPHQAVWPFLVGIVDRVARDWQQADRGIWEVRGDPLHFVHSKAMCWVALDRGIRLAHALHLDASVDDWARARADVRAAIERDGYDEKRGTFVRAFGSNDLDAALLLLPQYGFVAWDDPRMVRTTLAIRDELSSGGLVRRYVSHDGLEGEEGAFVACTFWLAQCLAHQGRRAEAEEAFEHAKATANDVGLFAEEFAPARGEMLGNFPQGLTHLAHLQTALTLGTRPGGGAPPSARSAVAR
jgi:GH15 family glucan-1,4-alpha-glucosidase